MDSAGRPAWVAPLTEQAGRATWSELSRFAPPGDGSGRASAVLVLLAQAGPPEAGPPEAGPPNAGPAEAGSAEAGQPELERGGPVVVLLERASTMRRHAGQVAFPGGAVDATDVDLAATALREAEEEIGLDPRSVDVLATLPALFLPPSNFVVTPVLAYWRAPHPLRPADPAEVATVAVVSVAQLVAPANRFTVAHPSGYSGPGFAAGGLFVWGFTAGVLDAVLRMGGWERPWDPSVTRALPARATPSAGTVEV